MLLPLRFFHTARHARLSQRHSRRGPRLRRLRLEPLEDRRVLAAVTVTNNLDVVNGDTSSIASLIANDGGDGIALREAIDAANNTLGADDVTFDFGHDGPEMILLELGELEITDALTITGDGAELLTIDASRNDPTPDDDNGDGSRLLNIDNGDDTTQVEVRVKGLSLTGADTSSSGGAIYSWENLTVISSAITGNAAAGGGGGIRSVLGTAHVSSTSISDNFGLSGGGILISSGTVTIEASTLSDNSAFSGGGISVGLATVTIEASTLSRNSAFSGGAVRNEGSLTITNSSVTGNTADAGGGIRNFLAVPIVIKGISSSTPSTMIINSTISGNSASVIGGGVLNDFGSVTLTRSTVTDNSAGSAGGGVYSTETATFAGNLVAGNVAPNSPDVHSSASGTFNLIGDGSGLSGINDGSDGNQIGTGGSPIDPLLGPLADNGGPTMTHALLAGSPAIDAGDPAFVAPPHTDQRGYYRIAGGRVDMGAYEFDATVPLPGDGNLDGTVNGLDYVLWAIHFGDDPALDPPGAPLNGDFNGDGVVDGLDYVVWAMNFEAGAPAPAALQTIEPFASVAREPLAVDPVIEDEYPGEATLDGDELVRNWRRGIAFDAALEDLVGKRKSSRHRRR